MRAVSIVVYGRVQGVYFRASTRDKAVELDVKGWCKDQKNGSVIIHAEASEESLTTLVAWCHNGPEMAAVKEVFSQEVEMESFKTFEIRP